MEIIKPLLPILKLRILQNFFDPYTNTSMILSQIYPNAVRPINDNQVTPEQHKLQRLCLREFSHHENFINYNVLGTPDKTFIYQTIFRKMGERNNIISCTKSYTKKRKLFGHRRKVELHV